MTPDIADASRPPGSADLGAAGEVLQFLRENRIRHWLLFDALLAAHLGRERLASVPVIEVGVDERDFEDCYGLLAAVPFVDRAAPPGVHEPDTITLAPVGGRRVVLHRTARRGIVRVFAGRPGRAAYEYHFAGAGADGDAVPLPRYAPALLAHWYGPGWRDGVPAPGPPAPLRPALRVLVDGVFDLFHVGHVRLLARAKDLYGHVVAGVHDDDVTAAYKRRPVVPHEHRVEVVRACRYVDEVLPGYPLITTPAILNALELDYVVHGAGDPTFLTAHYGPTMATGRFHTLPEFDEYHTTDLIARAATRLPGAESGPPG